MIILISLHYIPILNAYTEYCDIPNYSLFGSPLIRELTDLPAASLPPAGWKGWPDGARFTPAHYPRTYSEFSSTTLPPGSLSSFGRGCHGVERLARFPSSLVCFLVYCLLILAKV